MQPLTLRAHGGNLESSKQLIAVCLLSFLKKGVVTPKWRGVIKNHKLGSFFF